MVLGGSVLKGNTASTRDRSSGIHVEVLSPYRDSLTVILVTRDRVLSCSRGYAGHYVVRSLSDLLLKNRILHTEILDLDS